MPDATASACVRMAHRLALAQLRGPGTPAQPSQAYLYRRATTPPQPTTSKGAPRGKGLSGHYLVHADDQRPSALALTRCCSACSQKTKVRGLPATRGLSYLPDPRGSSQPAGAAQAPGHLGCRWPALAWSPGSSHCSLRKSPEGRSLRAASCTEVQLELAEARPLPEGLCQGAFSTLLRFLAPGNHVLPGLSCLHGILGAAWPLSTRGNSCCSDRFQPASVKTPQKVWGGPSSHEKPTSSARLQGGCSRRG